MPVMPQAMLEHARAVTQVLIRTLDPRSVVVFGGVGRKGIGNDLDLLILLDDETLAKLEGDGKSPYAFLDGWERRIAIDPFLMSLSRFREHLRLGSPFLNEVIRDGRILYMKNAESEWMKDATDELKTAEYLLQGGFWKNACYHAEQAVEKGMKARLLGKGWELEKIHSVSHKIGQVLGDTELAFIDGIYRGRSRDNAVRAVGIVKKALGHEA